MYYKVIKDGRVLDVLDRLVYVRFQKKHGILVNCTKEDAQGFVSSDGHYIWHADGMYDFPIAGYDTVELVPIDKYEWDKLVALNKKTPEEIIDAYTLALINGGVL